MSRDEFYITTPVYYVNDRPHVGHAYTTIVADALARYARLCGKSVRFLLGTDENSQKTVEAAQKSGEGIEAYADRLAEIWRSAWRELGISNTDFIRTTEERHIKVVREFWQRIWDKGDIYEGEYKGFYCKGHEAFMKESELINGLCPDHNTKPESIAERNYFFRLSKYSSGLLNFYEANPDFVVPAARFNEVRSFVGRGLEDVSISRETVGWGIPVPNDQKQVIYVWFDALINYVSAIGLDGWKRHPADVHTIGKDIIRFHAILWPAMLLSAGLPLPRQVAVNGFFTVNGVKISKSLGNAIDPMVLVRKFGIDPLRYFLVREIPYGGDGDFSEEKFKERYESDLANGLGNFAARVLALASRADGFAVSLSPGGEVVKRVESIKSNVYKKIEEFKFHEALAEIWSLIAFGDEYVNKTAPWGIKDLKLKEQIIFDLVVLLDNVAALLKPFLPQTSEKITGSISWVGGELKVKKGEILFPRLK